MTEKPQPSDVERQLEGRAALVVAARDAQAELEQVLASRGWQRELARSPTRIASLVSNAEAVREALSRIHRRAEVERWPANTPVLQAARKVEEGRARLHTLVKKRLEALGVLAGEASLEAALTRLEALARQASSWEPDLREVLIFETQAGWSRASLLGPGAGWRSWMPGAGRVRLTSERLLWRSALKGPRCVRLEALPDEGLPLNATTRELRASPDWGVFARSQADAANLSALVELVRWAPLREALRTGARLESVALFSAKHGASQGHCVLTSEQLSFIPKGQGPQALRAITGRGTSLPTFDADRLVDLLRWLPKADFDSALERVLTASAGRRWARTEVRLIEELFMTTQLAQEALRLDCGGELLLGFPKDAQEVIANGILRTPPA
ncbi:hypothetical protein MYSTI_02018 [Myxococcus stipitatus DSM 14675]|uniref:Uncharacterized protein n=1 Tax=Myxococcus stipitatus (strain DSM 14675 / JCM 12634 / Mx s8) TaxID=1278073 RepID=L7U701_MYXSD|nr:hypothetical protein [Myxococcus stipitatus]AGC43347.1 hypothetical protein MYSTI_02018 [Myxococcus stipitatus DSM 14675]